MLSLHPLAVVGLTVLAFNSSAQADTVLDTRTVTATGYAADALETPHAVEVLDGPDGASIGVAGDLIRESHRAEIRRGQREEMAGFVTADANFGWRFGKVAGFTSTGIDVRLTNLFDKRYHEHLTDGISGQGIDAPGRGIAIGLNESF